MRTFLSVVVLAVLGFLCFIGPDGVIGRRRRHRIESATTALHRAVRRQSQEMSGVRILRSTTIQPRKEKTRL